MTFEINAIDHTVSMQWKSLGPGIHGEDFEMLC